METNKIKFMTIKQTASEVGISEYTLRQWCKQKKVRFNFAGNTKYILRMDWLEEDVQHMALQNIKEDDDNTQNYGKLRRIEK